MQQVPPVQAFVQPGGSQSQLRRQIFVFLYLTETGSSEAMVGYYGGHERLFQSG
jgi:hypothetical protein